MPFFKEDGQVAVIVAIIIIVLIGMVVLVVDVGSLYEDRRHLQTVADASALAGAQDLPEDPDKAVLKAIDYANSNGVAISPSDVQISTTLVVNDTITVTPVDPNAKLYFASVLGVNSASVRATATATACSPDEISNLVPWGVLKEDIKPGDSFTLMQADQDMGNKLISGWYGAMRFGTTGGNSYRDNIENGCTEKIRVGNVYSLEPGKMVGPTDKGVKARIGDDAHTFNDNIVVGLNDAGEYYVKDTTCPRIVIVPVVEPSGKDDFKVIKFAVFFLEGSDKGEVSGRFVTYMIDVPPWGITGYTGGIKVIRLVK